MAARLSLPLSQQRHSNVAVVRYRKPKGTGCTVVLEIACYKNKVLAYRQGTETRINEVLQIDRVFTNVGRGQFASKDDLLKVLGPGFDERKALEFVLMNGELQIAAQEREEELSVLMRDVCTIVAQKCINPSTRRPYPLHIIEQAIRSTGFSLHHEDAPKPAALRAIRELVKSQVIDIARAPMRLRVSFLSTGAAAVASVMAALAGFGMQHIETRGADDSATLATSGAAPRRVDIVFDAPPEQFRDIDAWCRSPATAGMDASVTVLETSVVEVAAGDATAVSEAVAAGVGVGATVVGATSTNSDAASSTMHTSASRAPAIAKKDVAAASAAAAPAKGGKGKKGKKGKGSDDDDDAEGAAAGGALTADEQRRLEKKRQREEREAALARAAQAEAEEEEEHKAKNKRALKAAEAKKAQAKQKEIDGPEEVSDEDPDFTTNRRNRQLTQKKAQNVDEEEDESWKDGLGDYDDEEPI